MNEEPRYIEEPESKEPEGPIRAELGALGAGVERLEHQFSRLRGRLRPALNAVPRADDANKATLSDVSGSEIARTIRDAQQRVVKVIDGITETIEELEV